ncbi:response regulator transcription factor [Desulfoferrobacter suflitae]|uniref:response regulator transcription factor n=1 Tax=Desulfoferrobacter suflitae TaxID=2865782 RepID=UPI00216467B8|nr:response regulator transcription factor [Desulfoferrobacter suflitae]MCK8603646.1 response regulator transcription factor [Desulfoferrobacter suflitae]
MKVFIADDSAIVRERLGSMLFDLQGVEIIGFAENAQLATQAIRELRPDAVILDIRMPGGSGIDVLAEINKASQKPLVIILTNYPYPQYRQRCMHLGADFFFDKSGDFEKVYQVFEQLISTSNPAGCEQ